MSSQRLESGIGRVDVLAQDTGRRVRCADSTALLSPALALAVLLACLLVSPRPHNLKEMFLDRDGKL